MDLPDRQQLTQLILSMKGKTVGSEVTRHNLNIILLPTL
jgi:hypothetical protein